MNLKEFCKKNGYKLLDSIPENWNRYSDGIPSITTILSLLYDKGLEYIKKNYANELQQAVTRGTKMHNDAEMFFEHGGEINKQILKFHILYDVEIISKELNIKKDCQGTIDLVAFFSYKGKREQRNIDYKSSMNRSEKYRLQLAGYKYLNGNDGALLYIDTKNDKMYLDVFDTEEYMEAFIELKDYFLTLLQGQQQSVEK